MTVNSQEPNIETEAEWFARIGSRAAREHRVELRLSGAINAPVRGPRGLSACVKALHQRGFRPQTRQQAPELIPASVEPVEPKRPKKATGSLANCQPMTPKGNATRRGYAEPRKKWDARCSTCGGTGEIAGLNCTNQPCPRCAD